VAGLAMLAWGMIDDRFHLRPRTKIVGQIGVAVLAMSFGIQVRITQNPWIDLPLTLLWMVGLVNAFNFVDSMDGLALGLSTIALAFFVLVTLDAGQAELASLAAAARGGTLGLYIFNATPAVLFLGDSGAQLLGFLLASIGIAYVPAGAGLPQGVSWFTPILVLGVPIFDTALVVISRLRHHRPVYQAHQDHTYHRLVAWGMHPSRAVLAMQLAAILLGLSAFIALNLTVLLANLLFGLIVLCGLITIGVLFLLREFDLVPDISVWILVLLALGGWLFIGTLAGNRRGWFWPLTLVLIGSFMLLRDLDVIDRKFSIWPIVIIALGLAILLEAVGGRGSRHHPDYWSS